MIFADFEYVKLYKIWKLLTYVSLLLQFVLGLAIFERRLTGLYRYFNIAEMTDCHLYTLVIIIVPAKMTANNCISSKTCKPFVLVSDNTLPSAGEQDSTIRCFQQLRTFHDSAEVRPDVLKDLVFASSQRPVLPCSSLAEKEF